MEERAMTFTTVYFFAFLAVAVVGYYVLPKKIRWIWLLVMSYCYYFASSAKQSLFMVYATAVIYLCGMWLDRVINQSKEYLDKNKETLTKDEKKSYKEAVKHKKRAVLALACVLNFGMLAVVKYTNFALYNINAVLSHFGKSQIPFAEWALPLGISFFTFQSVSYVIDVYQGKYEAEKNPFKLGLFVSFFPQLLQGPIGRYNRLAQQLFSGNEFELKNIQFGLQRILWGIAKKIIIADRASVVVNKIFYNYEMYSGFTYMWAVLMYSVQLYMDFSGGIDIVIGAAQMFGIKMDENFRQPYFAKSIGDFWRRWHITLGTWMKDYIFYPMSLSKWMNKFSKWGKKHFGDFLGKALPICVADIFIFFIVGVWHGASWKYIAYGLYNGFIMAISALLKPVYEKCFKITHINSAGKPWKVVQIVRTFVLTNIGWYFDMGVSLRAAVVMIKYSVIGLAATQFTDGSLLMMGLEMRDYIVIAVGCLIVFVVSVMKEMGLNIREGIANQVLPVRWCAYYALILIIIVFGYTNGVSTFLYANF
jgi:D-alanyl-lipoteichoic acid acyltransferase DltB (MBOAT superfamily)